MSDKSSIKYILGLSIPIFFANLAIPLVGIVDTALMGNLGNKSYLAATSVATSFFSMIFWSFGFLRMGTVGIVSQSYGKKDYKNIKKKQILSQKVLQHGAFGLTKLYF